MGRKPKIRENYYVCVNGQTVEVTKEVYQAYYGGSRKERYEEEKDKANGLLYFGQLEASGASDCNELIEDPNADLMANLFEKELMELLRDNFSANDMEIIERHFIDGESLNSLAKVRGVHPSTLYERRDSLIKKLRIFLINYWL